MRNAIYQIIAIFILFVACIICFKYWTEVKFLEIHCGHVDRVVAYKRHYSTWNGKNEIGEDKSCYTDWKLNGKWYHDERWNVGNCSSEIPIEIIVIDYTCH